MRSPREWAQMAKRRGPESEIGVQVQMCFKKERIINHVNAAGRSSNTKLKKVTTRPFSSMQIIAALPRFLLSGVQKKT